MADTTTVPKLYNHTSLQRIEASELNAISSVGLDLDEEIGFGLLADKNYVVYGFNVAFVSGVAFSVSDGIALYKGRVLKGISISNKSLSTNGSGDPRIDVLYIAGPTTTASDSASRVSLSAFTRTPVAAEAVGTGDNSTTAFDLLNNGVDPRTIKVQLDAVGVGGWNYSPGTGVAGVDQIIFGVAPGTGVVITADYTHESGGAEGSSSLNTRTSISPNILIQVGTPAASPTVPATPDPTNDISLVHIQVPGGWSGGAPTSVDNTIKKFLIHPDNNADDGAAANPDDAGRVNSVLRNIDQVLMGARLLYVEPDTIWVTAMWGTLPGLSIQTPIEIALTLQNAGGAGQAGYVDATGWWYVYLSQAVNALPGATPALIVSQDPPTCRRRESVAGGALYVGAVYLTAFAPPVIEPFYTHGQWVFWQEPDPIAIGAAGPTDVDVSVWCPSTGRLLSVHASISYTSAAAAGAGVEVTIASHLNATGFAWPQHQLGCTPPPDGAGITEFARGSGFVRAEEVAGVRSINTTRVDGAGTVNSANLFIQGYLDDYRTLDSTGSIPTIY